jgi:Coenzyme PQQ synthesis protein D (PqqD)
MVTPMAVGWRRAPGVNWIEVGGDVVGVDEATGDIHVLEGAAAAVWQLLDGEPLDGLELLLAETFNVSVPDATERLRDSVDLLARARIIESTEFPD